MRHKPQRMPVHFARILELAFFIQSMQERLGGDRFSPDCQVSECGTKVAHGQIIQLAQPAF